MANFKFGCWLYENDSKNVNIYFYYYFFFLTWVSTEWFQDTPHRVSKHRQHAWEWEFAIENVACIDRIVQTRLLQTRKKNGKENYIVIRQVNTLCEGRVKITVIEWPYINLTCLTTTNMKKGKHCEHDNKDIMMVNMTFKWQWNEQFYKPSGRQVLLKHDKFIEPIS